jgi:HSP20 family molecular chaperone IbpA
MKVNDNMISVLAPLFLWGSTANGYVVTPGGGGRFYGRMQAPNAVAVTPEQRAEFRRQQAEFVNRAFDSLSNEMNKETARRKADEKQTPSSSSSSSRTTTTSQQEEEAEWVENAFGFASELFKELGGDDNEAKQIRDLANKGMGIAKDAMQGSYSPAYEINESESMFEISIDLPGVEKSRINILLEENLLTVSGERDMGRDTMKPVPFSKSFRLDKSIDTNEITSSLDSGVLLVRALKKKEEKASGKRIPVL